MFGGTRSKLKHWEKAGLITAEQRSGILSYEHTRKQGKLVKDLATVAVIAIFLGVLSLVAANWYAIPSNLKILMHFALNIGVMAYILRLDGQEKPILKDICLVGLSGLFLTFIALVGQIYQLHGDIQTTLLVWLGICTPFIWFYGRTYTIALPWLGVFLITLYMNLFFYLDKTGNDDFASLILTSLTFYLPFVVLLLARIPWLQEHKPGFAQTFHRLGLYVPAIMATLSMFMFYEPFPEAQYWGTQVTIMAAGLFFVSLIFKPRAGDEQESTDLWYYLLVSGIVIMLPFCLPSLESGVLAAVVFVGYWIFIAWLGARMQSSQLMDWAIRLVILRLFVIYIEVFGGMLLTGVGLIVSGIILLVVLKNLGRLVAVGRKLVRYEIG